MSQSKTFPLTDPAELVAKIQAAGGPKIDPTHPMGEASGDGVKLGWSIAGSVITITIISKPWIIPASTIWEHIDALFAATTA